MKYENELSFLRDILNKCHINTSILSPLDSIWTTCEPYLSNTLDFYSNQKDRIHSILGNIENNTQYLLSNDFGFRYICLKLPTQSESNLLFIGPYLSAPLTPSEILEIGEKNTLSPSEQKLFESYYSTLPIIPPYDRIFTIIDTFCEKVWETASFTITEASKNYNLPLIPASNEKKADGIEDILATADLMEMRYTFENELIRAVTLGQQHKENMLAGAFSESMFEKRLQDPLRNVKNYCIIMNTLLRKAAEQGGVHPMQIDKLSSLYAAKIELMSDYKKVAELMREIFSGYCRSVQKHSTANYSPIVKKAVLIIETDISAELTLSELAKKQEVSSGYLATIFKKETGKTVSEYIRFKRIEYAKYLLKTTELQVQTIALHCGIMDIQYFSKQFKKETGKTPKEYRQSVTGTAG